MVMKMDIKNLMNKNIEKAIKESEENKARGL